MLIIPIVAYSQVCSRQAVLIENCAFPEIARKCNAFVAQMWLCKPCFLKHPHVLSFISLSFTMTTSTLLFLAVCRMRVIHELSLMASLSMSSRGSVDRAPAKCTEGHGFDSHQDSDFFFVPCLCHVDYFIFIHMHVPWPIRTCVI